ncbi:MAG: Crp/Fnr family transcriptional regulator [Bacteroidota bacterium]
MRTKTTLLLMDVEDWLTRLSLFKEDALRREIIDKAQLVEIPAHTTILREGQYVKTIPLVVEGVVKVFREEGQREQLLYYIYPNESCIISIHCGFNNSKSHVKAITERQSTLILIPSFESATWQKKYPSFNLFVLNLYQKRFDDLLEAYDALAFQRLDARILSHLEMKRDILKISSIRITHKALADELGAARESVSRTLKKLESEGKVQLQHGLIVLLG